MARKPAGKTTKKTAKKTVRKKAKKKALTPEQVRSLKKLLLRLYQENPLIKEKGARFQKLTSKQISKMLGLSEGQIGTTLRDAGFVRSGTNTADVLPNGELPAGFPHMTKVKQMALLRQSHNTEMTPQGLRRSRALLSEALRLYRAKSAEIEQGIRRDGGRNLKLVKSLTERNLFEATLRVELEGLE